ncbi:uncharacterized protein LOC128668451 [Microplitis demolitor]|uniref:uncharacterized protein LOC128668451 n=1 Tax=Microplitis demolitor TaxID=69319 RepID=UPI0004CD11A1|nr:uncharacterized protein LOC128668451 [Microplitis demolitor]
MKPADVTAANEKELLEKIYKPLQSQQQARKNKFKVGDKRVQKTNPTTYKLVDYQDKPIEGGFYAEELSKVKYPDVYLVEKIEKIRGNELYVKWLGFDSSHNGWIEKSDL